MIHITKFETQAAYEAAESGLILPNVSLTVDNNAVHYNPLAQPSHEYVEIGGLKWATMNVGANSVTDSGLFFQWGDTQGYTADQVGSGEGKKYFSWDDYKWTNDGGSTMNKYNGTDGKTVLESSDDAVTGAWEGNWRMPTTAEFQALGEAVNAVWMTNYQGSGVDGLLCTDKTDSSKILFFPSAGRASSGNVNSVGSLGVCWSSSFYDGNVNRANYLYFFSSSIGWDGNNYRYYGCTARGVLDENS